MSAMTGLEYLATMTEAQLQNQVIHLAETFGWKWFHVHDSRRSPAGFPDLVLTRDGWLIFAELKVQDGHKGRVSKAQQQWLDALGEVHRRTGWVSSYVWRPSDLSTITKLLSSPQRVAL